MKTENSVHSHQTRHLDKWAVLSVIQKVDEAKNIAEMMNSSMEDLSEQMENLQSCMDCLFAETETIEEKIDELLEMIQSSFDVEENREPKKDPLPFKHYYSN